MDGRARLGKPINEAGQSPHHERAPRSWQAQATLATGGANQFPGRDSLAGVPRLSRRTVRPIMQSVVLRVYILTDRRPDQFASTEGTEVYLNTSFSDWYVPIFLVHEKETGSPFVCHPHDPKAALRVEELFQFATAVVHVNYSECYRQLGISPPFPVPRREGFSQILQPKKPTC